MADLCLDRRLPVLWISDGDAAMSVHRRTATMVLARRMQMYEPGEKVRILRGHYAGQIMTVRTCTADEMHLVECPRREAMSKGNVEPANGFTREQLEQAERDSQRGVR